MITVDDLLDYMEETAFHTPDFAECDCGHCMIYNSICSMYERMVNA